MDDILSKPYSHGGLPRDAGALDHARQSRWRRIVNDPPHLAPSTPAARRDTLGNPIGAGSMPRARESVRCLGSRPGAEALYARLQRAVRTSSQPVMAALDAALRDNDLTQAADLCHRLKSSAANVGARAWWPRTARARSTAAHGDEQTRGGSHER